MISSKNKTDKQTDIDDVLMSIDSLLETASDFEEISLDPHEADTTKASMPTKKTTLPKKINDTRKQKQLKQALQKQKSRHLDELQRPESCFESTINIDKKLTENTTDLPILEDIITGEDWMHMKQDQGAAKSTHDQSQAINTQRDKIMELISSVLALSSYKLSDFEQILLRHELDELFTKSVQND